MQYSDSNLDATNLDPDDWASFSTLAHTMLDDMLEYLQTVRDRPVWSPLTDKMKKTVREPLPQHPQNREEIYQMFKNNVLPYPPGNIHPRFWGWVNGAGSPFGMLAELAAAAMNSNNGGRDHMPKYVEEEVINWAKQLMGFPQTSSGILTSGCSEANLIGLTIARNVKAGVDVREVGLQQVPQQLRIYTSTAMHSSIQKACEVIGLGNAALQRIPITDTYQINLTALTAAINNDRENGLLPIAVVANVGTVNTGAIDPLEKIAKLCQQENLWLHVDGAFGAMTAISSRYSRLVKGLELADSLAFDFHKWMSIPFAVGCLLVKNEQDHFNSFNLRPSYLSEATRGLAAGGRWPTDYGIQLSKGFSALKIWFMLKENGVENYDRVVTKNILQAQYFAKLIEQDEFIELLAPVALNVVCFRFTHPQLQDLNAFNQELVIRIQESGIAVPSSVMLGDIFSLRIAITNHRSTFADFDIFYNIILKLGIDLLQQINKTL